MGQADLSKVNRHIYGRTSILSAIFIDALHRELERTKTQIV
jgi:hypothetical protein